MKNKKAFTVVELVIVIAIIAILAAVLIPTFANIIKKANVSKDQQLIRNLNTALASDKAENGGKAHANMTEALEAAKKFGYEVGKINASGTDNEILWDSKNDVFCYYDADKQSVEYIPSSVPSANAPAKESTEYWCIITEKNVDKAFTVSGTEATLSCGRTDIKWSCYLDTVPAGVDTITTATGVDAGEETGIATINYTNNGAEQTVIIRTNSFGTTLNITAPLDTVNHFGNAAIVNVISIAPLSYHENGTVGRLIVTEGHAVAEEDAIVFCLIDAGTGDAATVDVKDGAKVFDENGEEKGKDAVVEGTQDDCGAGNHTFGTQLVVDNKVYEVCKSCGYTLVTVVDLTGNEVKTTKVDSDGNIVNTPIETYNNTATNGQGQVVENKENPIIETPSVSGYTNKTCNHDFVGTVSIEATCTQTGVKTFKCSICGASYTSNIPMKAHTYYDNIGGVHTADEKCAVCEHVRGEYVAEVNGVKYTTLTDAIAAVPANTQTVITLINDDAIEGNAGWTIAATQNIVLDLNGYTLKNLVTKDEGSQVINNKGTLVIKDSSDLNKDGTGTGIIFNQAKDGANLGTWPTYNYVTNIVTNTGNFTLQSGKLFVAKGSSISYCVDNQSTSYDVAVIINGGQLMNHFTATIRQFCNSTTNNNVVTINGGIIKGYNAIWMQNPNKKDNKGTLTINGGTFYTEANAYLNGSKTISEVGTSIYNTDNSNHASNMYLTITGGEFFENIEWCGSTSHCTITGGTFHGYVDVYSEDATITGGTFNSEIISTCGYVYIVDGDVYVENSDGSKGVKYESPWDKKSYWENNGYSFEYDNRYEDYVVKKAKSINDIIGDYLDSNYQLVDNGNGTSSVVHK